MQGLDKRTSTILYWYRKVNMQELVTQFETDATGTLLSATTTIDLTGLYYGFGFLLFVLALTLVVSLFRGKTE